MGRRKVEGGRRKNHKAAIDNRVFHKADILETWADISKAKRLLGWEPKISFNEGLEKTIQWYEDNRSWVKDIQL